MVDSKKISDEDLWERVYRSIIAKHWREWINEFKNNEKGFTYIDAHEGNLLMRYIHFSKIVSITTVRHLVERGVSVTQLDR